MADNWYYARDGEKHGPFSAEQLKERAAGGHIRPRDTVWKEGMEKGVLAVKVKHLFTAEQIAQTTAASSPPATPPAALQPTEPAGRPASEAPAVPPGEPKAGAAADTVPAPKEPPDREPSKSARPKHEVRKRRVIGIKGGIIQSQDGEIVRFRKKCPKCANVDNSMTTLQIPSGTTRLNYFCMKCRKNYPVEVQGVG